MSTQGDWYEELEATRERLYEKVKDMTPEEWVAYLHTRADPVMKRYNLKWATL